MNGGVLLRFFCNPIIACRTFDYKEMADNCVNRRILVEMGIAFSGIFRYNKIVKNGLRPE